MSGVSRIQSVFQNGQKVLSVFLTAGYPELDSAVTLVPSIEESGVQLIELGIPFSDPIADGGVIQQSSEAALKNGMTLDLLFEQVEKIRLRSSVPILLMGYLNPIYQFGIEKFLYQCRQSGVDGLIIPDLPMSEYEKYWKSEIERLELGFVFLISPQTEKERIDAIASNSNAFIYAVSSNAVTGSSVSDDNKNRIDYYKYLSELDLDFPIMVGFGIRERKDILEASEFVDGAIVGSAFIKELDGDADFINRATRFVKSMKSE